VAVKAKVFEVQVEIISPMDQIGAGSGVGLSDRSIMNIRYICYLCAVMEKLNRRGEYVLERSQVKAEA